jgi:hypothetical protein
LFVSSPAIEYFLYCLNFFLSAAAEKTSLTVQRNVRSTALHREFSEMPFFEEEISFDVSGQPVRDEEGRLVRSRHHDDIPLEAFLSEGGGCVDERHRHLLPPVGVTLATTGHPLFSGKES